jgi:hypothetical protein
MHVEQAKLETDVLDAVELKMTDGLPAVIASANEAGHADLLAPAIEGQRLSLMLRLNVNKRLGRHEEAATQAADAKFGDLKHALARPDGTTKADPRVNAMVHGEAAQAEQYQTAFHRAASLDNDQVALVNGAMKRAGDAMETDALRAVKATALIRTSISRRRFR